MLPFLESQPSVSAQFACRLPVTAHSGIQVVAELNRARSELETEGRLTQLGKLCATPFGIDVVGITEFVALIGALVGGATLSVPATESRIRGCLAGWFPDVTLV